MSNLALGKVTQTKKNHIHVKKVGHTSELTFGIYWWTVKNPKIRILKKWKKMLEISSFYKCVPKTSHMRYNFLLFYPPNNSKIKILKKWSKHLQISSFHTCAPKNTIIWCMLTQIWSATGMTFWYFRSFFALLPHYLPWKLQFGKNVKSIW